MAAKWIDLLRMRLSSAPSVTQAITRPNISMLPTPYGALRIRDSGSGSGDSGGPLPSLVFACDAPNVLEHYDPLFVLLTPSHRLICLELPGFGFSYPSTAFDFLLRQYVAVVAHALDALGAGTATTTLMFPCAWSYVAFKLAAEHPAAVGRLVVSQCPAWADEGAWARRIDVSGAMAMPVWGQIVLAASAKRVADGWYDAALPVGRARDEFAGPARRVLADGGIFCLASLMQAWFRVEELELPGGVVEQPTVVMWGGSDRTHRHSRPEGVLQYLRRGRVERYPAAGHFPELEDPESLQRLLANEELWDGLRQMEVGTGLEGGLKSDGGDSPAGTGDNVAETGSLTGRRKPFDSHL